MRVIFVFVAIAILFGCKEESQPETAAAIDQPADGGDPPPTGQIVTVDSTTITVIGVDNRTDYPAANAIDGNENTFWVTQTVSVGDIKSLTFQFAQAIDLRRIRFVDNCTNDYNMGDLVISVSSDSTNGTDGTWSNISSLSASTHSFTQGDGQVDVSAAGTKWVKLTMTYNGSGAYGGTPAFYLSEAYFYEYR